MIKSPYITLRCVLLFLNALTAVGALRALIAFTLSNARRFYSPMENPLAVKGLTTQDIYSHAMRQNRLGKRIYVSECKKKKKRFNERKKSRDEFLRPVNVVKVAAGVSFCNGDKTFSHISAAVPPDKVECFAVQMNIRREETENNACDTNAAPPKGFALPLSNYMRRQ